MVTRWGVGVPLAFLLVTGACAQEKATKVGAPGLADLTAVSVAPSAQPTAIDSGDPRLPPLIPLSILFGNPIKSSPKVSPNGVYIGFLAPSPLGVLNVWMRHVGQRDERMLTNDTSRPIRSFSWSEDSQFVMYSQDTMGDENYHLYAQPVLGGPARNLTPFNGTRVDQTLYSHMRPDEVLISLNVRNSTMFDMYRMNITTGEYKMVALNPGNVLSWHADPDFNVLGAMAMNEDGGHTFRARRNTSAPWGDHIVWPYEEEGSIIGFINNSTSVYVASSLGSDTMRVLQVSMAKGAEIEAVVAFSESADVGQTVIDPITRKLLAVSFDYLKPEWQIFDDELKRHVQFVANETKGTFSLESWTPDRTIWTLRVLNDDAPRSFYKYHTETQELELLWVDRPQLLNYTLSTMEGVVIQARDGVALPSYLSLPPMPEGQEAKNLSMVLLVHGGPWSRDVWGYNAQVQWLTNRGYAVLQVNYRASTGYGKRHLHLGDEQWGKNMQNDLTDAVEWAISQGYANPNRVAIMGGSYGGYATLAGLVFTPDLYECGVDIVGPSNLATLFASLPDYWATERAQLIERIGDIPNDPELNREISPLFHVQNISAPLLIGQGANDPRVKRAESDQIYEAVKANDLAVEYYVYPDEGHGFARPENNLDFNLRVDAFLAKCLGGRHETWQPIKGATTQVIAGDPTLVPVATVVPSLPTTADDAAIGAKSVQLKATGR